MVVDIRIGAGVFRLPLTIPSCIVAVGTEIYSMFLVISQRSGPIGSGSDRNVQGTVASPDRLQNQTEQRICGGIRHNDRSKAEAVNQLQIQSGRNSGLSQRGEDVHSGVDWKSLVCACEIKAPAE
jgi:hypothetical protein